MNTGYFYWLSISLSDDSLEFNFLFLILISDLGSYLPPGINKSFSFKYLSSNFSQSMTFILFTLFKVTSYIMWFLKGSLAFFAYVLFI